MENYYQNRDEKNLDKIDKLLAEFPDFMGQFIVGIAPRTSVLTRLNYCLDTRVFFSYLLKYKVNKQNFHDITLSDLENLTPYDVERYVNSLSSYTLDGKRLKCNEKAKERKLSSLRSLYKYLYKKELISTNVTLKVDMPKLHDKPIIRLEDNEVVKLLKVAENGEIMTSRERASNKNTHVRDIAILCLFLGTGIRVSELVGINKSDIDFDNNCFSVTRKGGNNSILYMPDETRAAIESYLDWCTEQIENNTEFGKKIALSPDILFYSMQGTRISVRAVEKLVKKYAGYATPLKKITPHKLRSTFATNLYRKTDDIYVVADVLGHSDVNTTKRHYAQMSEENRKKAARVTKIIDDDN